MRVSARSDYGLKAVLELAEAYGRGPVQSGEIAARRGVPESYLEQIMTVLRKAGLVLSVRGPQGGHVLASHPSSITVRTVIEALDGPLLVLESSTGNGGGGFEGGATLQRLWSRLRLAMETALEGVTVQDLADMEMADHGQAMYQI